MCQMRARCAPSGDAAAWRIFGPDRGKRFARDSSVEGAGFELSVPGRKIVKPAWETGLLHRKRERICWGTEGSNPSLSSGESAANLRQQNPPLGIGGRQG